ncbi:hypothetical protein [Flindersiella endophytica]
MHSNLYDFAADRDEQRISPTGEGVRDRRAGGACGLVRGGAGSHAVARPRLPGERHWLLEPALRS